MSSTQSFIISCSLVLLGEFASFCSKVFKCSVNSLVSDFSSFARWVFSGMNLHLNTAFIVSYKFGYVVWSFSLNFRKSFISPFISSLTHFWFRWALFNFHVFVGFLKLVLLLTSSFMQRWSNKVHWVNPFFAFYGGLFCYLVSNQFLRRFHEVLRRRYNL